MSSRSVSGGATSKAARTRAVCRDWAAHAATSWQPRLCATSSAGVPDPIRTSSRRAIQSPRAARASRPARHARIRRSVPSASASGSGRNSASRAGQHRQIRARGSGFGFRGQRQSHAASEAHRCCGTGARRRPASSAASSIRAVSAGLQRGMGCVTSSGCARPSRGRSRRRPARPWTTGRTPRRAGRSSAPRPGARCAGSRC